MTKICVRNPHTHAHRHANPKQKRDKEKDGNVKKEKPTDKA